MKTPGLVRFVPRSNKDAVLIGEPVSKNLDVGLATHRGDLVRVEVFSGSSVLNPGISTQSFEVVDRLLSPLSSREVGSIRCIGLNVPLLPFHRKK